ncbi:MAG: aldolase catalytic domain-containing protein [Deltaproteobacteria bacterium]|nr:aldolase catalytic domain-containing protein [Deltaproteobacteria bacterium]
MYRPEIKVLDCSIRDGGLMNKHQFSFEFVRKVYKALSDANVDYIELGYRNSKEMFSPDEYGAWKFCDDEDILRVTDGIESNSKISVMADVGRVDMDAIKPASESPVDMIRTAVYVKDIDKAIQMANEFHDKGYETTINVMAISRDQGIELDEALDQMEHECRCDVIYIVDSFGALYQEQIQHLVKRFKKVIKTKEIGFHGHNNQQLAFSNTIEAIIQNANRLDGTVYGIGRAAGNCHLELLLGFLKNPNYNIRPVLDLIADEFIPLRENLEWGYTIPYAITGMRNEHPRSAMALRSSEDKDNYSQFYESLFNSKMD